MSVLGVIGLIVGAFVLVAIVMSFFVRRHGESGQPSSNWRRTNEVFIDPTTKRRMRVWVDPADGSRHYVAEA